MHVRITRFEGTRPDELDAVAEATVAEILPVFRLVEGYRGLVGVADRETGTGLVMTFWESEEALQASEEAVGRIRVGVIPEGTSVASIEPFEVMVFEFEP